MALVAVASLLLVACGSDHRSASSSPSSAGSTPRPSATAPSNTSAASNGTACPQPAYLAPGADATPPGGYQAATAALQRDQQAAEAWGAQHPDRFSATWVDVDGAGGAGAGGAEAGPGDDGSPGSSSAATGGSTAGGSGAAPGRLVVAVTGDPADVRADLEKAVTQPDRLVVCRHQHSAVDLQELAGEVEAAAGSAAGAGADVAANAVNDAVIVQFAADQQAAAKTLHERFGDAVHVSVGLLPYPLPSGAPPRATGPCRPLPVSAANDGLSAELVLGPTTLSPGGQARGTVHIRNTGKQTVDLQQPQPLDVVLVRPGTDQVVGASASTPQAADYGGPIEPGGTMSLPVTADAASCDPALGYVVPPGDYQAMAVVPLAGIVGAPVVSDPVSVTVTG
jgi:hypothetical protein